MGPAHGAGEDGFDADLEIFRRNVGGMVADSCLTENLVGVDQLYRPVGNAEYPSRPNAWVIPSVQILEISHCINAQVNLV